MRDCGDDVKKRDCCDRASWRGKVRLMNSPARAWPRCRDCILGVVCGGVFSPMRRDKKPWQRVLLWSILLLVVGYRDSNRVSALQGVVLYAVSPERKRRLRRREATLDARGQKLFPEYAHFGNESNQNIKLNV
jgi:hypothetical protein